MKKLCLILCLIMLGTLLCITSCNESEEWETVILNEWDERKVKRAILSLENSPVEGITLAKWIYTVAFSASVGLDGEASDILSLIFEPQSETVETEGETVHTEEVAAASINLIDMVVPTLYRSEKISDEAKALLKGKSKKPTEDSFVTGDLIVSDDVVYIYNGERLAELKAGGIEYFDTKDVIKGLKKCERWAVLRPANVMKYNPATEWSTEGYTDKQKAIVATAEAFMLRGMRAQYDDTRFFDGGEFRWQIRIKAPEDYTQQEWGYTNCAAFCVDVHRVAVGYKTSYYSTYDLVEAKSVRPYYYQPTFDETEEERAKVKEEFLSTLEPGDIIIIRRVNGTGHAMLYVGCGDIIHSSGGSYSYKNATETYEPTVRYMRAEDLFTPEVYPTSYIFEKVKQLAIIRPTMKETLDVTENARARLDAMQGIVAEKLSSHNKGVSANTGDEITYTISLFNTNDIEKTVDVSVEIPENTTLVKGDIPESITIPALEHARFEYTVRVESGDEVQGEGTTIGGLEVNCLDVAVANTLTADEQRSLDKEIDEFKLTGDAVADVNGIYEKALGTAVFEEKDLVDVRRGIFKINGSEQYVIRKAGGISKMTVDSFWGGRNVYSGTFDYNRVRLVKPEHLIVGDLILLDRGEGEKLYIKADSYILDLVTGEKLEDEKAFLEGLLSSEQYFALLRPSFVLE